MSESATDAVRNFDDSEPSEAVVMAVAEAKDVDPLDLDPLNAVIDPDALNKLFRPTADSPQPAELHFSMENCEVVVRGDGEVVATPPPNEASASTPVAMHED